MKFKPVFSAMKLASVVAIAAVSMVATVPALAAGTAVDVADTVTTIGLQLVPIGLVGTAVLGVFVAVKAFKWIHRALS